MAESATHFSMSPVDGTLCDAKKAADYPLLTTSTASSVTCIDCINLLVPSAFCLYGLPASSNEERPQRVNSEGLAKCRCGSANAQLITVVADRVLRGWQAECLRCGRRGPGAPRQTAISLWNADCGLYDSEDAQAIANEARWQERQGRRLRELLK